MHSRDRVCLPWGRDAAENPHLKSEMWGTRISGNPQGLSRNFQALPGLSLLIRKPAFISRRCFEAK